MTVTEYRKEVDKKLLEVKSLCSSGFEYDPSLKENSFFDEIEKIDHLITVPLEYRDMLEGHVCRCGKLILSSFLPKEIAKEYTNYIHQKSVNIVIDKGVESITETINKKILKTLMEDKKNG